MSNKNKGNKFEREIAQRFFDHGYWVTMLNQGVSGQPADLIACKTGTTTLIECKDCSTGKFMLSRIEPNQISAMGQFWEKTNTNPVFALNFPEGVWYVIYEDMMRLLNDGVKSLTPQMCKERWGFQWF